MRPLFRAAFLFLPCYNHAVKTLIRLFAIAILLLMLPTQQWATCGGGGGGGMGGMGGGGTDAQTYPVPWKVITPNDAPPASGLVVYWLPASQTELEKSSLRNSRTLSLYAQQC